MKVIPKDKIVYSFSPNHAPIEYIDAGETILLEAEDAVGGQVRSEDAALESLDWSKVDGVTGPIFVNGAEKGDTLKIEILDIKTASQGVILAIPGNGVLKDKKFRASAKITKIDEGFVQYDDIRIKSKPIIGTIGVAPAEGEIASSTSGKHGGNMDCKELGIGTKLYLPVCVKGALFAAGDIHAAQTDGELCVAAIEVSGTMMLRFNLIKKKQPSWPLLETDDYYNYIVAGESLDQATITATATAVDSLMRAKKCSFEKAYMLSSILTDIKINQVVDPQKGVRASIPRREILLDDLLT